MGTSVCIISGKDGVGKTFLSVNLGFVLSTLGLRVLVVDGDLEGPNVGLSIGIDRPDNATLNDILGHRAELGEAILKTKFGFHLLTGDLRVTALEGIQLNNYPDLLKILEDIYDVVIVDTTSKYGPELTVPLASCLQAIIVLEPNILSISDSMKAMAVARGLETKITGIVINKIIGDIMIPASKVEEILESKVIGTIPHSKEVPEAIDMAVPLCKENPDDPGSQFIRKLAGDLIRVVPVGKGKKLANLLKSRRS